QLAPPRCGLRHRAVDRGAARRPGQGVQHDHRAVQEAEPAEDRSLVEGRSGAGGGDVRTAFRQDHRGADPGRRRQRTRRMSEAVQPIRWKGKWLELLDQRLLPGKVSYVKCRTAAQVAKAIKDMVVRGAP